MAQDNTHEGNEDVRDLSIDELDQVDGGYVFRNGRTIQLIDDNTGEVLESASFKNVFFGYANAMNKIGESARRRGLSDEPIFEHTLDEIRKNGPL